MQRGLAGDIYESSLALSGMVVGTLQRARGVARQEGRS